MSEENKDITASVKIEDAENLIGVAEGKARDLLSEAAIVAEERHKEMMTEMITTIEKNIEIKVNGKIDTVAKKFDEYIKADMEWKKEDKKWKEKAMPVVKLYIDTTFWGTWIGKRIKTLAKFIVYSGAVVGAWVVIRNFFLK